MPIIEQEISPNQAWGLWRIEEEEEFLFNEVKGFESVPESITHPKKRLEYIAGRVLIKTLLNSFGKDFFGIKKDTHGKPFLNKHIHPISLSHSYPYVAAIIDREKSVGIDLEQPKQKLLAIAPRVLHEVEFQDAGTNLYKHCIYWCAKETLLKVHGKKDLILAKDLRINPFSLQNEGKLIGRIIDKNKETPISLYYRLMKDFVIVFTP